MTCALMMTLPPLCTHALSERPMLGINFRCPESGEEVEDISMTCGMGCIYLALMMTLHPLYVRTQGTNVIVAVHTT